MNSLDELLEVQVSASLPHSPDSIAERCNLIVLASLAQADDPVRSLDQLAQMLDGPSVADADWRLGLPGALREHSPSLEPHRAQWQAAVDSALLEQAHAYADWLPLGSLPVGCPRRLREQHRDLHLERLMQCFSEEAPRQDALPPWRAAARLRQQAWQALNDGLGGSAGPWDEQIERFTDDIRQAMDSEASLQMQEGALSEAAYLALFKPEQDDQVQWLCVHAKGQPVPGVWAMVNSLEWQTGMHGTFVLWVHGEGGGMIGHDSPATLLARLAFTLQTGGLAVAARHSLADTELSFEVAEQGLAGLVRQMFTSWREPAAVVRDQEQQQRELSMARAALAIPSDTCRQAAMAIAERRWQAQLVLGQLPNWMLRRSQAERQAYVDALVSYNTAADNLDRWLKRQLADFPTFAGQLLVERIQADKGIRLSGDTVLLHRPVSASYVWISDGSVIDPAPVEGFNSGSPVAGGMQWQPGDAWENVTLEQLACEGFAAADDTERARLRMATVQVAGVDWRYLANVLVELDPLGRYEKRVIELLAEDASGAADILRQPYVAELQLLATAKTWSAALSEEGAQMLRLAASARDVSELDEMGMGVHWLAITSVGDDAEQISGTCALVSNSTGRTLLYLPQAPGVENLVERQSLQSAVDYLGSAINLQADLADYVAQRCGKSPERLRSYLRQAGMRGYTGYLKTLPSAFQTLVGIQLADRRGLLIQHAREQGRSQSSIRWQQSRNDHERHVGYLRVALSLIPGVNLPIAFQDIHQSARSIADGWGSRDADALGWGVIGLLGALVDVLTTVIPAGSSLSAMRRAVRLRTRQQLASRPFAGFEAKVNLKGGEPLDGADQGTWRLSGQQYIWQDGRAYAVYRRPDDGILRLRSDAKWIYEPPVARDGQRWVLVTQDSLAGGGGKLNEAERIFADWGPRSQHPRFARTHRVLAIRRGRAMLADYDLPESLQAEFALSCVQDGSVPDWARTYRRSAAGAAAEPTLDWQRVRWNTGNGEGATAGGQHGGEAFFSVHGTARAQALVRVDGFYYPTLPGSVEGVRRYVVPSGRLPNNLDELDELIRNGHGPIRVELGATQADPATVLGGFAVPFSERLAERVPGMSALSRQAFGELLYRGADTADGLTQRRLLTLERWLDDDRLEPLHHLTGQNVDIAEPLLRPLNSASGLGQLRWTLSPQEQTALRGALGAPQSMPGAALGHAAVSQAVVTLDQVLTTRGYEVLFSHGFDRMSVHVFRRAAHSEVYFLVQWQSMSGMTLRSRNGTALLSEAWIDGLMESIPNMELAQTLRVIREGGGFRQLIGGLHVSGPDVTELVWQRVLLPHLDHGQPWRAHSWRTGLRELTADDHELLAGSGLYGVQGDESIHGVIVQGQLLPVFPVEASSSVLLTRSAALPLPLDFDTLALCLRERMAEQAWMVLRSANEWTVRRALFSMSLENLVIRARPGLTQTSALNAARTVYESATGLEHARLLQLENTLTGWTRQAWGLGELADPLLLLRRQLPLGLDGGEGWRLGLPADIDGAIPPVLHLRPVDPNTQWLMGIALTGGWDRQREVIDELLRRYGLVKQHAGQQVMLYSQRQSRRTYLVLLQSSPRGEIEVAFEAGQAVLSRQWIEQWLTGLPEGPAQTARDALNDASLVKLVATLRMGGGEHFAQVALQRLGEF